MAAGSNNPLRSTLANDPEMSELVELFVSELPQRVGAIESAWNNGKVDDLRRLSHQLRGSSASYGFAPLGQAAGQVEDQLRGISAPSDDSLRNVKQTVDELLELCRRAMMG